MLEEPPILQKPTHDSDCSTILAIRNALIDDVAISRQATMESDCSTIAAIRNAMLDRANVASSSRRSSIKSIVSPSGLFRKPTVESDCSTIAAIRNAMLQGGEITRNATHDSTCSTIIAIQNAMDPGVVRKESRASDCSTIAAIRRGFQEDSEVKHEVRDSNSSGSTEEMKMPKQKPVIKMQEKSKRYSDDADDLSSHARFELFLRQEFETIDDDEPEAPIEMRESSRSIGTPHSDTRQSASCSTHQSEKGLDDTASSTTDETEEVIDETEEVIDETEEVIDETEDFDGAEEVIEEIIDETEEVIDDTASRATHQTEDANDEGFLLELHDTDNVSVLTTPPEISEHNVLRGPRQSTGRLTSWAEDDEYTTESSTYHTKSSAKGDSDSDNTGENHRTSSRTSKEGSNASSIHDRENSTSTGPGTSPLPKQYTEVMHNRDSDIDTEVKSYQMKTQDDNKSTDILSTNNSSTLHILSESDFEVSSEVDTNVPRAQELKTTDGVGCDQNLKSEEVGGVKSSNDQNAANIMSEPSQKSSDEKSAESISVKKSDETSQCSKKSWSSGRTYGDVHNNVEQMMTEQPEPVVISGVLDASMQSSKPMQEESPELTHDFRDNKSSDKNAARTSTSDIEGSLKKTKIQSVGANTTKKRKPISQKHQGVATSKWKSAPRSSPRLTRASGSPASRRRNSPVRSTMSRPGQTNKSNHQAFPGGSSKTVPSNYAIPLRPRTVDPTKRRVRQHRRKPQSRLNSLGGPKNGPHKKPLKRQTVTKYTRHDMHKVQRVSLNTKKLETSIHTSSFKIKDLGIVFDSTDVEMNEQPKSRKDVHSFRHERQRKGERLSNASSLNRRRRSSGSVFDDVKDERLIPVAWRNVSKACLVFLLCLMLIFDIGLVVTLLIQRSTGVKNTSTIHDGKTNVPSRMLATNHVNTSLHSVWDDSMKLSNGADALLDTSALTSQAESFDLVEEKDGSDLSTLFDSAAHLVASAMLYQTTIMEGLGTVDIALIHAGMIARNIPVKDSANARDILALRTEETEEEDLLFSLVVMDLTGADLEDVLEGAVQGTFAGGINARENSAFPYAAGLRFSILSQQSHGDISSSSMAGSISSHKSQYKRPRLLVEVHEEQKLNHPFLRNRSANPESNDRTGNKRHRAGVSQNFDFRRCDEVVARGRHRNENAEWVPIDATSTYRVVTTQFLVNGGEEYRLSSIGNRGNKDEESINLPMSLGVTAFDAVGALLNCSGREAIS